LFFTFNLLQAISFVGLTGLLISPFFFPGILYGLPQFPTGETDTPRTSHSVSSRVIEKKNVPQFEEDYLDQIRMKIETCMDNDRPYLQADCNIASVARLTSLPVHHLSYYFREVNKQSFNDFRNKLRVDHAKKLIREGKAKELTLEAIGILSGFSTRNTFYTAFKKVEGMSPSGYSSLKKAVLKVGIPV